MAGVGRFPISSLSESLNRQKRVNHCPLLSHLLVERRIRILNILGDLGDDVSSIGKEEEVEGKQDGTDN